MNPTNPNENCLYRQIVEETLYESLSRRTDQDILAGKGRNLPSTLVQKVGRTETREIDYDVVRKILKERGLDYEEPIQETEGSTEVTAIEPVLLLFNPLLTDVVFE